MRRSRRRWPVLAAGAGVLMYLLLTVVGLVLLARVPGPIVAGADDLLWQEIFFALSSLAYVVVGAIIVAKLPTHPVGWLFLALGMFDAVFHFALGYAQNALAGGSDLPAADLIGWLTWSSPLGGVLLALVLLLFPDGHLVSARWRIVGWFALATGVVVFVDAAFTPGPLAELETVDNPFGWPALEFLRDRSAVPLIAPVVIAAVVSLLVRFRQAYGEQRQQLKWLALSAGFLAVALGLVIVVALLGFADEDPLIAGLLFAVVFSGIPMSAGVAILRYRLYDIDVVINRTLVYGGLSAILAAAYLIGVLLLQLLLGPLTERSDLAVAGSTLAVAALFRPARARIQGLVDQRFYRRRYDATRTLEAFSARLRVQLDLEALGADLRAAVRETVQPTTVTLWLQKL